MSGNQEVTISWHNKFTNLFELANGAYLNVIEKTGNNNSRMQNPDQEFKPDGLITSYEAKKEVYDHIFAPDTALINLFLLTYGKDLSEVKIHTGPYAEEITHKAGADALTFGKDIYFSSGSYAPHTEEGEALLLHEVEHVRQNQKGQRLTYREDVSGAEKEAYKLEGQTGHNPEDSDLFEIWKQDDLVFKNKELIAEQDASDKDLEDFTESEPIEMYRYLSPSGKVIEMTTEEYRECLVEVKEKLVDHFKEEMMYGTEDEKIQVAQHITKIFGI